MSLGIPRPWGCICVPLVFQARLPFADFHTETSSFRLHLWWCHYTGSTEEGSRGTDEGEARSPPPSEPRGTREREAHSPQPFSPMPPRGTQKGEARSPAPLPPMPLRGTQKREACSPPPQLPPPRRTDEGEAHSSLLSDPRVTCEGEEHFPQPLPPMSLRGTQKGEDRSPLPLPLRGTHDT